jgi:hypothetical protein
MKGRSMVKPTIRKCSVVINKRGKKKIFFALDGSDFVHDRCTLEVKRAGTGKPWPSGIVKEPSSAGQLVCWLQYESREGENDRGTDDLEFTVTNPDGTSAKIEVPRIPVVDEDP